MIYIAFHPDLKKKKGGGGDQNNDLPNFQAKRANKPLFSLGLMNNAAGTSTNKQLTKTLHGSHNFFPA